MSLDPPEVDSAELGRLVLLCSGAIQAGSSRKRWILLVLLLFVANRLENARET